MLLKFFLTCNKIGAFTLGGGYAMIPIMEREFVDNNKWMDRQEFMDIMVVAQSTPGIFAIDMASHIGYKLKGVWGGIVGSQKTPLLKCPNRMDANGYMELLEAMGLWSSSEGGGCVLFQRDGATCHTARKTKQWFVDNGVTLLEG